MKPKGEITMMQINRIPTRPSEMIRLLLRNGFKEIRGGNGPHRKFKNLRNNKTTCVPYHSKDIGRGLSKAILAQAGLS